MLARSHSKMQPLRCPGPKTGTDVSVRLSALSLLFHQSQLLCGLDTLGSGHERGVVAID
jgi:hypothetical protein